MWSHIRYLFAKKKKKEPKKFVCERERRRKPSKKTLPKKIERHDYIACFEEEATHIPKKGYKWQNFFFIKCLVFKISIICSILRQCLRSMTFPWIWSAYESQHAWSTIRELDLMIFDLYSNFDWFYGEKLCIKFLNI